MKRQQGFALVTTLLIAALVGTLVAGSLMLSVVNRRISGNDALSAQTLNVAQAGSAFWKAELVSLYRFMLDNPSLYADDIATYQADSSNPPIACDNYFAIGIDFNRDGTIDTANAKTATKTGLPPNGPKPLTPNRTILVGTASGSAQVSFYIDGPVVGLRSRGSFSGSRATVVEEFTLGQANIWNNAVFASSTAADATIQGRAEIRGAVHVLGEGALPSSTVLDLSGNFGLGNTYEGLVSSVAQDVTGTSNYMRLTTQHPRNLCATLRVKNGKVKMQGSASIGDNEDTNPEPYKDLMEGIYTNNGIDGGTEGSNVYSKNGMRAKYDVGDLYDFPDLIDNTDGLDYTAGTYPFPAITKPWQEKLEDNSLVLSTNPSTAPGNLTPDDRSIQPVLLSDANTTNSNTTFAPPTWRPGMTYLSASCVATPLFGVRVSGSTALTPDVSPALVSSLRQGLTVVVGLYPALQTALPMLGGWACHRASHRCNGGGGGTTTTPGTATAAAAFTLTSGTTAAFNCRKYRLIGSSPDKTRDEIVTEVVWSGNTTRTITDNAGINRTMQPNELYVGGKGGGVMFWGKNLNIGGSNRIGYYGNGVLFAEDSNQEYPNILTTTGGNINLTTDFTPANNNNWSLSADLTDTANTGRGRFKSANVSNTYPATALVGLVARINVITDGSQRRLSTTVYAQEEVAVNQQAVIAGSIVAKSFDAGSNVPTVLFVPNLSQNLSKLMPGAGGSSFSVSNTAWNRR